MALAQSNFTADQWEAFTADDWESFLRDPAGGTVGRTQFVVAAQAHVTGAAVGDVHTPGALALEVES